MRAFVVPEPPSVETIKAPAPIILDRRSLTVDEVRNFIRREHALPRRRAAYVAGRCLESERIARMYLPPRMVDELHGPDVRTHPEAAFIRRVPRMVGTGEAGRMDRAGVTAL